MSLLDRLSLNQATIKHANLIEAVDAVRAASIPSIGLWREPVSEVGLSRACQIVADSGLRFSSLCRGGFFTTDDAHEMSRALDDNRRAIEETAALAGSAADGSAAVLVLVAGGLPAESRDLSGARHRVADAIAALADDAAAAGVTLAIEPMHPMYAADRGVISTLGSALDIAEQFPPTTVGVVVDAFHVWWDPDVLAHIVRAGTQRRIASYQINDWITPLPADTLLARGLMGTGHIDLQTLTTTVLGTGYSGDIEVEIFNADLWNMGYDDAVHAVLNHSQPILEPNLSATS